MSEDERLPTRSERVYEALLLAYPKDFRLEYGRQLAQVFGDLRRQELARRGRIGLVALWVRALLDLGATALVERAKINGRGLLAFGGRIANLKGLVVVNATVVIVAALWSAPGLGAALSGLLRDEQGSLSPLALSAVWAGYLVYPLAGVWLLVRVICYPERGFGRTAIRALFAANAAASVLLLGAQIRGLADALSRRRWAMENFGVDPLAESMGTLVLSLGVVAVYLLFALGYGYFLKTEPSAPVVLAEEGGDPS